MPNPETVYDKVTTKLKNNKLYVVLLLLVGFFSWAISFFKDIKDFRDIFNPSPSKELVDVSQGFNSNPKVTNLYSNILLDYPLGTSIVRIKQDFGAPKFIQSVSEDYEEDSQNDTLVCLIYDFTESGHIELIIDREKGELHNVRVELDLRNDVKIKIPGLIDKGSNYPDIVLGKSTFGDLFNLNYPDEADCVEGGTMEPTYSECLFYFGRFGEYANYLFGTFEYSEKFCEKKDIEALKTIKPSYYQTQY